ncbi:hypothetical protein TYRP_009911 [Tyrophagus putrescentiae]|nr:hypothetical protein TYRP_009911 [Tyrophagus putrescentiae]
MDRGEVLLKMFFGSDHIGQVLTTTNSAICIGRMCVLFSLLSCSGGGGGGGGGSNVGLGVRVGIDFGVHVGFKVGVDG